MLSPILEPICLDERRRRFSILAATPNLMRGSELLAREPCVDLRHAVPTRSLSMPPRTVQTNPKDDLPPVILRLMQWREAAGLSQSEAAAVLQSHNFVTTVRTIQTWERGYRRPRPVTTELLNKLLDRLLERVSPSNRSGRVEKGPAPTGSGTNKRAQPKK
jgi:DNA-binding transcriptional regulator YiaG